MIGEIAVVPQMEGSSRKIVAEAVGEMAAHGLRCRVGVTGTCVEGEFDDILGAVRAITMRLGSEGIKRALVELRLQLEPHPETLEHQGEGIALENSRALDNPDGTGFGLTEPALRERLEEELPRSMHVKGDRPAIHSTAHSVARLLEQDHLRMAKQLEQAGIRFHSAAEQD